MNKCMYCKQEHNVGELCKPSRRTFLFLSSAIAIGTAIGIKLDTLIDPIKFWDGRGPILTESQIVGIELEKVFEKLPGLYTKDDKFYSMLTSQLKIEPSNKKLLSPLTLEQLRKGLD